MKKYDIAISVILILVSGAMFTAAGKLPEVDGAIGAGTWPRVLSVMLFLLAALMLIQALMGASKEEDPFDVRSPGFRRVLIGGGILAAYCILMKFLGFMIASAFMIPAIMRLMGEKRPWMLVGITAVVLAAIYVIFAVLLKLPMLQGSLL
ncbi:tripartite tricarboxylate transporter TctB family protein [uncultured Oscillibacter sp.]|jgi:putative tricarboxylic transport membrane protein|uniref:tripartite tricarboxylate transporter TctB family protein n=1 Tax=uncultured Oscillibacter sp. TaxID=876091 RepID=UPI00261C1C64|nr:tripartite tricarboxylate transporter TctB family protein [uncultured Oscillibacter sp.]